MVFVLETPPHTSDQITDLDQVTDHTNNQDNIPTNGVCLGSLQLHSPNEGTNILSSQCAVYIYVLTYTLYVWTYVCGIFQVGNYISLSSGVHCTCVSANSVKHSPSIVPHGSAHSPCYSKGNSIVCLRVISAEPVGADLHSLL